MFKQCINRVLYSLVSCICGLKALASVWCCSLFSSAVTAHTNMQSFSHTLSFIDRESRIPVPPAGHHWKEVRHDNTVTWLASWTENIQGSIKYIMLNANSKLKVQACSYLCTTGTRYCDGLCILTTFYRSFSIFVKQHRHEWKPLTVAKSKESKPYSPALENSYTCLENGI